MPTIPEKKIDSRVKRSKRDLANALEELLQEKNLDDITITEITERAMVSKNTFYNNFLDKNELVMFMFQRYLIKIAQEAFPDNSKAVDKDEAIEKIARTVVHFFYTDSARFKKMIENDHSKTMFWNINRFVQEVVSFTFKNHPEAVSHQLPEKIVALFYSGAVSNLIYYAFLNNGPKVEEEEVVGYMIKLFRILD